jgi:hypothetical protein
MRIGIIGGGLVGDTLATLFAACGHTVLIAPCNELDEWAVIRRDPDSNVTRATVLDAAKATDVVILAVPFRDHQDLPADAFDQRVVVDATNYFPHRDGFFLEIHDDLKTSSEMISRYLVGSLLVKAFNAVRVEHIAAGALPGAPLSERIAIPVAGDHESAKAIVCALITQVGFCPIDNGMLWDGHRQQPGTAIYLNSVEASTAARLLAL